MNGQNKAIIKASFQANCHVLSLQNTNNCEHNKAQNDEHNWPGVGNQSIA